MRINFILRIGIIFSLAMPLLAIAKGLSFSGKWTSAETVEGQRKPYSTFTITLSEDRAGNIQGSYCFITQNGNRIDCSPDKELNISGQVERDEGVAVIKFFSFFGAVGGIAKITVGDGELIWDVVTLPKGGDYYGPLHVKMKKDASAETRVGERVVVANKAFLYDVPSRLHKTRDYLVKGDCIKLLSISPDLKFWKIEATLSNKRRVVKWIECADIDLCAM